MTTISDSDMRLGQTLMDRGLVSREALNIAASMAYRYGGSLAATLERTGVIAPDVLRSLLASISRRGSGYENTVPDGARSREGGFDPFKSTAGVSEVVAGVFQVERLLGEGAMGKVFLARDPTLDGRRVAVKTIRREIAGEGAIFERFLREARAAASVKHPNVLQVHRMGTDGQGTGFLVMEYIRGGSLDDRIADQGSLPERDAADIVAKVADGLAAAHDAGVFHRDLKPQNIFIEEATGRPVLGDFGLASLHGAETLTKTGQILGSPVFMSPEQARGEKVDERSEVYGLGATLYKCVAGVAPYHGHPSVHSVLRALSDNEPPEPPSTHRADLCPALESVIAKAMAPLPRGRYPTARAFAATLRAYLATGAGVAVPASRSRTPWIALASLAVLGAAGAFYFLRPVPEVATQEAQDAGNIEPEGASGGVPTDTSPGGGEGQEPALAFRSALLLERPSEALLGDARSLVQKAAIPMQSTAFPRLIQACRALAFDPRASDARILVNLLDADAGERDESKLIQEFQRPWMDEEVALALLAVARSGEEGLRAVADAGRMAVKKKTREDPLGARARGALLYALSRARAHRIAVELLALNQASGFMTSVELAYQMASLCLLDEPDPRIDELLGEFADRKVETSDRKDDSRVWRDQVADHARVARSIRACVLHGDLLSNPIGEFENHHPIFSSLVLLGLIERMRDAPNVGDRWHPARKENMPLLLHAVATVAQPDATWIRYPAVFPRGVEVLAQLRGAADEQAPIEQLRRLLTILNQAEPVHPLDPAQTKPLVRFLKQGPVKK